MHWYLEPWKKYATFKGRARRREYWIFALGNFVIAMALTFGLAAAGMAEMGSMIVMVFWVAAIIPSIAAGVRRMHDSGRSGWWIIVPLVNLIFALLDSEPGTNEYGPNPKGVSAPAMQTA